MSTTELNLELISTPRLLEWLNNFVLLFKVKEIKNLQHIHDVFKPNPNKSQEKTTIKKMLSELYNRKQDLRFVDTDELLRLYVNNEISWDSKKDELVKNSDNHIFITDKYKKYITTIGDIKKEILNRKLDLTKLHTKQLLKLLKYAKIKLSYDSYSESEIHRMNPQDIFLQIDKKSYYATTMDLLKKELSTREHVPSKSESKEIRKLRAKYKITYKEALEMLKKGKK